MRNDIYDIVTPEKNLNTNHKNIYSNLIDNVDDVLNDISKIDIQHIELKTKNEEVKSKLKGLRNTFKQDVEKLDRNAVWDRFTIAFFGETNAGKSTIIESLRISMQEASKLENQNLKKSLDLSIDELNRKSEEVITSINQSKKEQIENLNSQLENLNKRAKVLEVAFWAKCLNIFRSWFGFIPIIFFAKKTKLLQDAVNEITSIVPEQDKTMIAFSQEVAQLKKNRESLYDGEIIGTGVQDFTQSCIEYKFDEEEKPFALIDVPGIEGNEGKYEAMIMDAVSKAHCIFYVCSAGKLPESGTIAKIKRYLKEQTEVYFLLNERKNTYSYEEEHSFEAMHSNAEEFKKNISNQMRSELGEFFKGCYSLQGLMAFCSVAEINPEDRNFKFQNKLLAKFNTTDNLYSISQLEKVESLIRTQLNEMESKIINANIQKGICATIDFKSQIEEIRTTEYSDSFVQIIEKEIKTAKEKNNDKFRELQNELNQISFRLSDYSVGELRKKLYHLVDNKDTDLTQLNPSDRERVLLKSGKETRIKFMGECYSKYVFDELSEKYKTATNNAVKELTKAMKENIVKMQRNLEQIATVSFTTNFDNKVIGGLDSLFSFDWGKLGSATISLAGLTPLLFMGPIGIATAIILGIAVIWRFFAGGESPKAKAKRQVDEILSNLKSELKAKLDDSNKSIIESCREKIINKIIIMLDDNLNGIKAIQKILDTKTGQLDCLIEQIKNSKK